MVLAKEAQLPAKRALPIPLIIPAMLQTPRILKKKKKSQAQAMIIQASAANMYQSQKKKIESAPYLTPSSSPFSPLCALKTLSEQAFYPKDGPISGPSFPLSISQIIPSDTPPITPILWIMSCSQCRDMTVSRLYCWWSHCLARLEYRIMHSVQCSFQ